ncbi:hypothetical protein AABB24_022638, partial [Solanum stoloniferum]
FNLHYNLINQQQKTETLKMPIISITSPSHLLITIFMILLSSKMFCISLSQNLLCPTGTPKVGLPVTKEDIDLLQFSENLEFLEAEYFLWAVHGYGLDIVAPELAMGGPPPIGVRKANLDFFTSNIINEFAMQEVGHLSSRHFAHLFDEAFGYKLQPPFDPYRDSLNFMLSCYALPYAALVGYVGTNPLIQGYESKRLLAGLLGVESGQDAMIRMYLYERAGKVVYPYRHTVAEFTIHISNLRNRLAMCGIKDEGLFVPWQLGAENRTTTNILSADFYSLSQWRTPEEILRIMYNTGSENAHGGFFPRGANGNIAKNLLKLECGIKNATKKSEKKTLIKS